MLKKLYNTALSALLLTLFLSCGLASSDYPTFPKITGPSAGTWEYPNNNPGNSGPSNTRTRNEGTWYQIFTGSFYSSKNNGQGDIQGIIEKLDYLNDSRKGPHPLNCEKSLHVDGIWLTPIMPAPSYHKYDTTDYNTIDPAFGTMKDFQALLDECHKRGIKLIVDLAVNHTSPKHQWFINALREYKSGNLTKYSKYYNFHTSKDRDPDRWSFGDISNHWYRPDEMLSQADLPEDLRGPDIKTPPDRDNPDGRYIFSYGAFGPWMPDLNWNNKAVKDEFEKIIKFWLVDIGIDGWRLDATKHIFEVAEWTGDTEKNIAFWTWFAETCRKYKPDTFMVGECLDNDDVILQYHRPGMSSFALGFANDYGRIVQAARLDVNAPNYGDRKGANYSDGVLWFTREVKNMHPLATFSPFLSNHDFDRSSNHLTMDEDRKMGAALLLLIPGTPFMYYGEEIGIVGWKDKDTEKGDKDPNDKFVRGPMIFNYTDPGNGWVAPGRPTPPGDWSPGKWGNTQGKHGMPYAPWNDDQGGGGGGVNQQLLTANSLLRYYIKVGNLKRKYPWIAYGKTDGNVDKDGVGQVAAFRVTDDDPDSDNFGKSVIIAHNTSKFPRNTEQPGQLWRGGYIKVPNVKGYEAISALGLNKPTVTVDPGDKTVFWIEPYATVIFREYDGDPK